MIKIDDDFVPPHVIHSQSDSAQGQKQFCHNLIVNLIEKGDSPCNQEFPEMKKKRTKKAKFRSLY